MERTKWSVHYRKYIQLKVYCLFKVFFTDIRHVKCHCRLYRETIFVSENKY